MSELTIEGRLIVKGETQNVSDRFKKREFVIELTDEVNGNNYTNYAKMQLVQGNCDVLDRHNIGDNVRVSFNVKGNKWERDGKTDYITNLDAWKIDAAGIASPEPVHLHQPNLQNNSINTTKDDLPF